MAWFMADYLPDFPGVGGGEVTIPGVGNVRSGIAYGEGDSLTGTLVIPAEEDVESGVQYGADGTEYTGTLIGGNFPDPSQVLEGVEFGDGLVGTLRRIIPSLWR